MAEQVFTIFAGPDKGRAFVLRDTPLEIGREQGRDVVLSDERASRHHITLRMEGGQITVTDENSSNGTFLNGRLIDKATVKRGDVIKIAATKIVCGDEAPTQKPTEIVSPHGRAGAGTGAGSNRATQILAPHDAVPGMAREPIAPLEVIEAVAEAVRSQAKTVNIRVSVETGTEAPGEFLIYVVRTLLQRSMIDLILLLLKELPLSEGALVLRYSRDIWQGGGRVDILAILCEAPVERIKAMNSEGAFDSVREELRLNGAQMLLLPEFPPGTLARLILPAPPDISTRRTLIK